jgi:hypothetical protein
MKKLYKNLNSYFNEKHKEINFSSTLKKEIEDSKEIIVVHQMGKVGSKSIEKSLRALNLQSPIYHTHRLNIPLLKESLLDKKKNNISYSHNTLIMSEILLKAINRSKNHNKRWKIITLVREPISRNVSEFLHKINQGEYFDNFYDKYFSGYLKMDEIIDMFLNKNKRHNLPLEWLDQEIPYAYNIDIFEEEFPKLQGYATFQRGNIDLLVIKLEHLDKCCQQAFQEFLNIDNFVLMNDNVGNYRKYSSIYQKFKEQIAIPQEYIDKMYTSRYTKHFYMEEEIDAFKQKWSKSSSSIK